MATYYLLFLSWFLFIVVAALDNRGKSAQPGSMRKTIDSVLFSGYHRRITVYFVSALGIPINIILSTISDFMSSSWSLTGLYSVSFAAAAVVSVLFARIRDNNSSSQEKS